MEQIKQKLEHAKISNRAKMLGYIAREADYWFSKAEIMELLKEVGDNCYSRGIKDFEKWNTTSSYKSELFEKYWQQFKEEMK